MGNIQQTVKNYWNGYSKKVYLFGLDNCGKTTFLHMLDSNKHATGSNYLTTVQTTNRGHQVINLEGL